MGRQDLSQILEPIMTAFMSDASRSLSIGDIVKFRFPHTDGPGRKNRPCLVIHVDDETGEVVLSYVTSRYTEKRSRFSLTVVDAPILALLNLMKPTRFLFERRIRVQLTDPRFRFNSEGDPVIGRYSDDTAELEELYSSLPIQTPDQERQGIFAKPKKELPKQVEPPKKEVRRRGLYRMRRVLV
jgi:hypothetical protein